MTRERKLSIGVFVAAAVVAIGIPFVASPFRVGQFTLVLAYAVAVLGLNLLVGYSGQISLGHGAFFALGAYVSAILIVKAGVPYLLTVPAAAAVSLVAGLLLGLPALRLRGLYLALVTLAVAVATPQLIKRFDGLTGGTQGLNVDRPSAPGWIPLADDQFLYFVTLVLAAVLILLGARFARGATGRALIAIRDNETAARTMGVNLARYKTATFAVGSMLAGAAGSLYVFSIGFVAPESFTLVVSFSFLAAVVVGGLATVAGAIFGALFIEFVPVYSADVNEALAGVIYGGVLILFMYALPDGVMGLLRRLEGRIARREEPAELPGEEPAEVAAPARAATERAAKA